MRTSAEIFKEVFGKDPGQDQQVQGKTSQQMMGETFSPEQSNGGEQSILDVYNSIKTQKSPLTIPERAVLSFADDEGKLEFLQHRFGHVMPGQNGTIMVGDDLNDLSPIDPAGIDGDFLKDIADFTSLLPSIVGQSAGAALGTTIGFATGGPPGAALGAKIGAGVGSGAGEMTSQMIGKALGVNHRNAQEEGVDVLAATVFGTAGEAVGQALKGVGQTVKAQLATSQIKFSKLLNVMANSKKTPEALAKFAGMLGKVFKITSAVPEEATVNAVLDSPELVFTKYNQNELNILDISGKSVRKISGHKTALGKELGKVEGEFIKAAGDKKIVSIYGEYNQLVDDLTKADIIDAETGMFNNKYTERGDLTVFKRLLGQLEDAETGKPKVFNAQEALAKRHQFTNIVNVTSNGRRILTRFMRGITDPANGRQITAGFARKIQTAAENSGAKNFAKAFEKYANFAQKLDDLADRGLDLTVDSAIKAEDNIENFIRSYYKGGGKSEGVKRAFQEVADEVGGDIASMVRRFATAQVFMSSNPSLWRWSAIVAVLGGMVPGIDTREKKLFFAILFGSPWGAKQILSKGGNIANFFSGIPKVPKLSRGFERQALAGLTQLIRKGASKKMAAKQQAAVPAAGTGSSV